MVCTDDRYIGGMTTLLKLPPGVRHRLTAIPLVMLFGLLGCAIAGLLSWQAAEPLASEAHAVTVARTALALDPTEAPVTRESMAQCVHPNQDRICEPILPAAADPAASYVEIGYRPPRGEALAASEAAYHRLQQDGWDVGKMARGGTPDALPGWQDSNVFWAVKGDDVIRVDADSSGKHEAAGEPTLTLDVYRQAPSLVTAAAAIGLLLGALVGWLVTAAVLRRVAQQTRRARFTIAAAGIPAVVLTAAFDAGALVYAGYLAATFGWSAQDSLFAATAFATVIWMFPIGGALIVAGLILATVIAFRSPRVVAAACVVLLAASMLSIGPDAMASPSRRPKTTLTLISGDGIDVHSDGHLTVRPRKGMHLISYSAARHRYVIPTDALPLLRTNRIDRRLFDVTVLLDAGYDKRDDLGIIVTGDTISSREVTRSQLPAYWTTVKGKGTGKVWLDGVRHPSLDVSVPHIGAPAAWAAGLDGTGVTVAVLDTGIDTTHPDLAGKVVAQRNFASEAEDDLDHAGHGTHVAATIAGSGSRYTGVAPGARLLNGKVCASFGCQESWILAGMRWAAQSGAKVVNMSLGGPDTPGVDLLEQAVNDLTLQYGTLFVVAAGNSGPADETIESPASADAALAVGAVTKADESADFSSRGPRKGDAALKPDLTAPGVDITAAVPGGAYASLTGTSMATPHVAGAAAILSQQHPDWTAARLKATLMASAETSPTIPVEEQGAGRVDVARAITQTVVASPPAISFGRQDWPHQDDPPLSETITYQNRGNSPIALRLTLTTTGTFKLSADSVTVPAGAEASVTLTADTRLGDKLGPLGGHVVAAANGIRVETPFAVDRETETYTLQLVHTGRDGAPATDHFTVVVNTETFREYLVDNAPIRLPRGTYFVASWIMGADVSLLMWPKLELVENQTVPMDARQARAFDVTVPDRTVTPIFVGVTGELLADVTHGFGISASLVAGGFGGVYTKHLGPQAVPGFVAQLSSTLARLDGQGGFDNSPVSYDLAWHRQGSFFTGFTRHLRRADLAEIATSYSRHSGELAWRTRSAPPSGSTTSWGASLVFGLPAKHTEFVTTETAWRASFGEIVVGAEGKPEPTTETFAPPTSYLAGQTYHERWNTAVLGPVAASTRNGDELTIMASLLSDHYGHTGNGMNVNARIALYRHGELVDEQPGTASAFLVPPVTSRYRVESSMQREARLSTSVRVAWEFTSAHTDATHPIPLTTIGLAPVLDQDNKALPSTRMVVPISASTSPRRLSVDVSYDDGLTWTSVQVVRLLGLWAAVFTSPSAPGFVSVRVRAEDFSGNTVEQTVIRAWEQGLGNR
jgi:subtilisin family serine protease